MELWREDAGTAAICGYGLPPDAALAADQAITTAALRLRAAGLAGTMDQLRARAYLDALLGMDSRPSTTARGTPAPGTEPGTEPGGAAAPGAAAPGTEAASAGAPGAEPGSAGARGAEPAGAEPAGAEPAGAEPAASPGTPGAEPGGTELAPPGRRGIPGRRDRRRRST